MACELKEALEFVAATATACFFLRRIVREDVDMDGLADALESLTGIEPVTREAWQALARVVRHLVSALEDTGDARVLLLYELRDDIMARVDAGAARSKGV